MQKYQDGVCQDLANCVTDIALLYSKDSLLGGGLLFPPNNIQPNKKTSNHKNQKWKVENSDSNSYPLD